MKDSTKKLLDQLRELTAGMDLPSFRKDDPKWLAKNMSVRNAEHPNFSKASELVKELVRMGLCILLTIFLMSLPVHALTVYPDDVYPAPYIIIDCSKCCDCDSSKTSVKAATKVEKKKAEKKVVKKKKIAAAKKAEVKKSKPCPDCPPCPAPVSSQVVKEKAKDKPKPVKKGWWIFGPVTEEDLYTSIPGHSHGNGNSHQSSSSASTGSGSASGEGGGGSSSGGSGNSGGGCSGGHGGHSNGHGGHHGGGHGHSSHGGGCK